jgi:hypothetical protein
MVKNYQMQNEELVLAIVKRYPLYSVDKIKAELPQISRHTIQRILEKNGLSKVEFRLNYLAERKRKFLFFENFQAKVANFGRWRCLRSIPAKDFRVKISTLPLRLAKYQFKILSLGLVVLLLFLALSFFVFSDSPEIFLEQPAIGVTIEGESLLVTGRVRPKNSQVFINGKKASLNGDGTFTTLLAVPVGQSSLTVEAVSWVVGKRSQLLRSVNRALTNEEVQAKKLEEAKQKREAADKAAQIERTVNDLLAVKNDNANQIKKPLKIVNSRLEEEAGFLRVVGEVTNFGKEELGSVMITASFSDANGNVLDTKYGFATNFGKVIRPGETLSFETQATTKDFDHYGLALAWEDKSVAGATVEVKEATASSGAVGN